MDMKKRPTIVKAIRELQQAEPVWKISPAQKAALQGYDDLPDAAGIRLPTLMALKGVSAPTIWRWTKKGLLPPARKTGGTTSWNVGELRRHSPPPTPPRTKGLVKVHRKHHG